VTDKVLEAAAVRRAELISTIRINRIVLPEYDIFARVTQELNY